MRRTNGKNHLVLYGLLFFLLCGTGLVWLIFRAMHSPSYGQLENCPEFSGVTGERVYHFSYVDVRIVNSWLPLFWNWGKLPCLVQSATQATLVREDDADDAEYNQLQRELHLQFYPRTGEVYSVIPNRTTSVLLTQQCMWGAFQWTCLIPHNVTSPPPLFVISRQQGHFKDLIKRTEFASTAPSCSPDVTESP